MYVSQGVVESYPFLAKIQNYFRRKRVRRFIDTFYIDEKTKILDIGGAPYFWQNFPIKCKIYCLNIYAMKSDSDNVITIRYDGNNIPFPGKYFDIVHSNSVIEHVGSFNSQMHFSKEIQRVGRNFWVQVPYYYFFWEPHAFFPFFQFIPDNIKKLIIKHFNKSPYTIEELLSIHLLSIRELKILFPKCKIIREKFVIFTKSIIAYTND